MWDIELTKQAAKDLKRVRAAGLGDKAHSLIEVLQRDPFSTMPSFEALVGNLEGCYSRRINRQHRLVYEIYQEPHERKGIQYKGTVRILRMWTHYGRI
ncbi:Txe/YoeB family addiction module toxin [Thermophilibacter provencensis]|uniref:Txe/YoeB family addiction module toxin n=1 Tax=Thermophilibacter provencensis TaxID=1852386 RepID=UPI0023568662|nr:Txe/YoeB family addiction module toxin [Thermophilibacter provencensis]